jgi:hypothetical protein
VLFFIFIYFKLSGSKNIKKDVAPGPGEEKGFMRGLPPGLQWFGRN